jgi:hypothetical protein
MKKIYRRKKGSIIPNKNVVRYGKRIDELIQSNQGDITPEAVLKDARSRSSPLHDFFTWDDTKAAEKWRLQQAGYLLRNIEIEVVCNDKPQVTRAFFNVSSGNGDTKPTSVYVSFERAFSDTELRQQVINAALDELMYWQTKYRQYTEFAAIFSAIQTVAMQVRKKK